MRVRILFGLKITSEFEAESFMILEVTMIRSSTSRASILRHKYTICRKLGSLLLKSFEVAKKRSTASFLEYFSPVDKMRMIFVKRMRHLRGLTGEVLNTRKGKPKGMRSTVGRICEDHIHLC